MTKEDKVRNCLYLHIGPKGAGKTHIGTYIDAETDIHFLRVEPIWIPLKEGEDVTG